MQLIGMLIYSLLAAVGLAGPKQQRKRTRRGDDEIQRAIDRWDETQNDPRRYWP